MTWQMDENNGRIARLERKIDLILEHLGIADQDDVPGAVSLRVRQLAAAGNKIGAIKQLREETNMGLKEAKDTVDALGY